MKQSLKLLLEGKVYEQECIDKYTKALDEEKLTEEEQNKLLDAITNSTNRMHDYDSGAKAINHILSQN